MIAANKSRIAAVALAIVFATSIASAAPVAVGGTAKGPPVPSVLPLTRFYPTPLPSSPGGRIDEPEVWAAKVQGLLAAAPPLLQEGLLNSRTVQDFNASVALIQQMQEGLLKQAARDLKRSNLASGRVGPKALGDAFNLVYKPVEPCRIMDSRNATAGSGVQGPITSNALYHVPGFINAGQNWGQYGGSTTSDCGLTNPPGNAMHAIALVVTILAPNFDSFLGISDVNDMNSVLSQVALNYTRGQGLSTMYIVPQVSTNTIYFAFPPQLVAHLIFDVAGYYVLSDATALQCATQSSGPTSIPGSGGTGTATSPTCAAGYTLTGGNCDSSSFNLNLVSHEATIADTAWFCSAINSGVAAANLTAAAKCCRVPGK